MKLFLAMGAVLSLSLGASTSAAQETGGDRERYLGDLTGRAHGVRGSVYAVGEEMLRVEGFWYDGSGPDAFFYVGREESGPMPSGRGALVPYPGRPGGGTPRRLAMSTGESVLLTLPEGWKNSELRWISVWCRRFAVNFGELILPEQMGDDEDDDEDFQADEEDLTYLGDLTGHVHGVSGSVYLADEGVLLVKDFYYDGIGPDVFFYVGKEGRPSSGGTLIRYPTWDKEQILGKFEGEDVRLALPPGLRASELKWIAVWSRRFEVNFGDLILEDDEDEDHGGGGVDDNVVGSDYDEEERRDDEAETEHDGESGEDHDDDEEYDNYDYEEYGDNEDGDVVEEYGDDEEGHKTQRHLGDFQTLYHDVAGSVYVADEYTLRIKNFRYDGVGRCRHATHFRAGDRGVPNPFRGLLVPYPLGAGSGPLARFDGGQGDIFLHLPANCPASGLKWLSVWCSWGYDFGHVIVEDQPKVPEEEKEEEESPLNDGNGQVDLRQGVGAFIVSPPRPTVYVPGVVAPAAPAPQPVATRRKDSTTEEEKPKKKKKSWWARLWGR